MGRLAAPASLEHLERKVCRDLLVLMGSTDWPDPRVYQEPQVIVRGVVPALLEQPV